MAQPEDDQFSVYDVAAAALTPEVARQDIEDSARALRDGDLASRNAYTTLVASQVLTRRAGLTLLDGLEELGSNTAATLRERLEAIDPEETPLAADMFTVAHGYEADRVAATDPEESTHFKQLATIAQAVAGIATVKAIADFFDTTDPARSRAALQYAQQVVAATAGEVSDTDYDALNVLLAGVRTGAQSA